MVPQFIRRDCLTLLGAGFVLALITFASACDRVPLLAPSGTVITLFPVASSVPLNGQVEIVATVIEQGSTAPPPANGNGEGTPTTPSTPSPGAGTPVQNGTVVTFTSTLGRIEPREARTSNGQVRVTFIAGSQSGIATITAFSGGASGRLENLLIGTAAVERVIVNANPQTLGAAGGTSELTARVEDVSGLPVAGVSVSFASSAGQLNPNPANTDQNGIATTTLTTTREASVTATVAGKTSEPLTVGLNPRTGVGITGPTDGIAAGQPAVFTVNVSADANIRNVVVNWGDGTSTQLGALSASTPVQHTYATSGTFVVRATASDANGFSESVQTVVTVLPAQPPSVLVTASDSTPSINQTITITATVSGNTSSIQQYQWDFGDGTTAQTTSPQITKAYATAGTKVIRVTVLQAVGPSGTSQTTVTVTP
jgi:hypothetical protein